MFFSNGVLFSALLPRYPELKAHLDLSDSAFGLSVVGFAAGAICAAAAAAPLIRRAGAARVTWAGSIVLAVAMTVAGGSQTVWMFAAALFLAGLIDAIVDAAQNVAGLSVERTYGRSIINSLHAVWSLGAATGGAIGAAAAALDIGIAVQMMVNGALWSVVAIVASRLVGPSADPAVEDASPVATGASSRRALRLLAPLVLLAICGTLIEDIANNWAVLFSLDEVDAPIGVATLAVTVMIGSQFVGRLLGDPMTDRWGRERVARAGGVMIAAGMACVALSPGVAVAFAGFALAGFGSATLVPAAFAAADRVPGLAPGTGIAVLGWLMRLGFLLTSPAVGALSDVADLRVAFLIPVAAGVVAAIMAHLAVRRARRPVPTQPA